MPVSLNVTLNFLVSIKIIYMTVKPKILTWDVVERGMNEFIVTSVFERIFVILHFATMKKKQ